MRSVKKNRIIKQSDKINKKEKLLSGDQVVEIVNTVADVAKSGINWLNEIEKTKQMAIEAQVRITESNNRLKSELKSFEKDMFEIQKKFEEKFKKLDDDYNMKMKKLDLIEKVIDKIDKLELEIKIYQDKEGLTSSFVMTLFEQLHQQKLAYINNLVLLGRN